MILAHQYQKGHIKRLMVKYDDVIKDFLSNHPSVKYFQNLSVIL